MQVTETLNEGLKRGYAITVTAAELDEKVNEKLVEAQPEVEMKGFRKGKVPMALLKKQFGQRLMGEAMQEAVDGAMNKHFEDSGDRPALQPDVKMTNEDWKEGDDVNVEMSYEALPEIPEVDFSGVELEKLVVKAEDEAVTEALANLAETAKEFEAREEGAAAEDGDQVVIDFVGKIDGEAFDGGAGDDYPLTLGSNSFIPGFEEQLVGTKAGEEKDVTVSFPEEYGAEHLAGKEGRVLLHRQRSQRAESRRDQRRAGQEVRRRRPGRAERARSPSAWKPNTPVRPRGAEARPAGRAGHPGFLRPAAVAGRGRSQARSRTSCGTRKTRKLRATTTVRSKRPKSTPNWPSAACAWACCWPSWARKQRLK